jgi:hypothetical protein
MKKYAIYAAGGLWPQCRDLLESVSSYAETLLGRGEVKLELVALSDSNSNYWGTSILGVQCVEPKKLKEFDLDKIIISTGYHAEQITNFLINELNFSREIIDTSVIELTQYARIRFLRDFADMANTQGLYGSVAEGGVFKGTFAREINKYFPERMLYLFDSFDSFNEKELASDREAGLVNSDYSSVFLKNTSEDIVRDFLPFPEKAIFKKGYFPQTTAHDAQLENEHFVFVNLDFDLYQPTLAGLEYFYPKMTIGGTILIHDYFCWLVQGARKAVDEFCANNNLRCFPIGDGASVAIMKN